MATSENNDKMQKNDTLHNLDKRKPSGTGLLGRRGLFVVVSGPYFGNVLIVNKPVMTLGRNESCDLSLDDDLLSREHCRITADDKRNYFIEDLSSTNSTWLNAKEVKTKIQLHYGDRILIGRTLLRFFLEEEAEKK